MYYNLWRNGEELPNPYTFNTNSLDDIRNFLAWDIVDNFTSGDECLKGTSISNYNLVYILVHYNCCWQSCRIFLE